MAFINDQFQGDQNPDKKSKAKKRVTVYLTSFEIEIIKKVMSERNVSSITDALSKIIIEYGAHKEHLFVENDLHADILENSRDIKILNRKCKNHDDRLDFLESQYVSIARTLSESKFMDQDDDE